LPPPIRFVTTPDGLPIAYSVHGSAPPLVFVRGWISHLEAMWERPAARAYFEALGERFTVVRYDTRGQGLSDRDVDHVDVDAFTIDLEALIDRLDLHDIVVYGQTFGGPIAITYAARHPYRVDKLVLDGTYAKLDIRDPEGYESMVQTIERLWPDSVSLIAQLTTPGAGGVQTIDTQRDWSTRALTGEMAGRLYRLAAATDVREHLGSLTMPVLVMHRRRSRAVPMGSARALAADIPRASFVALEGAAHNPWDEDPQTALDAVGAFLGMELRLPPTAAPPARTIAILFTDMEASTALTSRLGDARAQELVRTHDAVVRRALGEHGGVEEKHTGDGLMASFASISAAVDCALAIQRGLREHEAPFRVKIGIDAGEPLRDRGEPTGTVVQSARRIVDRADPGQILVSDVVRRLIAGRRLPFVDRGRVALKGLPERVRLYEISSETPGAAEAVPLSRKPAEEE
jgi:class 3 adenylate cyclase